MATKPPSELWELSIIAQRNSLRWFPDDTATSLSHMTLALCGEVGALANIMKLIDRGEINPNDAHAHFDMVMRLADVFVYVLNIAALLKCDLLRAYEQKTIENEKRFADSREKQVQQIGWISIIGDER